jgi:phosphoribosylanthranilate isomerase
MIRVKLCGITNHEDALMAVKAGAHALGFIFAESPRQINPEKARDIINALPPFVQTVGVFVNEDPNVINKVVQTCGLNLIQLHGDEPPNVCNALRPNAIKAFQLKDEADLETIGPYIGKVKALLLDTYSREKRGGTGKTFDWELAVRAGKFGVPVILSGGLSPANIKAAVSFVKPFAVDLNSGVEDRPGKKNPQLLNQALKIVNGMPSF